jgi:hypothetical protein
MMTSLSDSPADDAQVLVDYLLGCLPAEETERLDELSIADDEFAWRLRAAENDLVDAYVRGELSGDTLERFRSSYLSSLSSPERRQKVTFADTLLALESHAAPASGAVAPTPPSRTMESSAPVSRWRHLAIPRSTPHWGLVAAALLMAVAAGYFVVENRRLQRQVGQTQARQAALEETEQELRRQLEEQRSTSAGITEELARLRASVPRLRPLALASFVLLPQTRGAGQIATISVPPPSDRVTLRLRLESDDFSAYQATLRDLSTSRIVWRSDWLKPGSEREGKSVSLLLPTALLKPQNYSVELAGKPTRGPAEFITSYAFRAVLQ